MGVYSNASKTQIDIKYQEALKQQRSRQTEPTTAVKHDIPQISHKLYLYYHSTHTCTV